MVCVACHIFSNPHAMSVNVACPFCMPVRLDVSYRFKFSLSTALVGDMFNFFIKGKEQMDCGFSLYCQTSSACSFHVKMMFNVDEEYQLEQLWWSVWACLFSMLACLYICVLVFMFCGWVCVHVCEVLCRLVGVIGPFNTALIRDTHPHRTAPMRLWKMWVLWLPSSALVTCLFLYSALQVFKAAIKFKPQTKLEDQIKKILKKKKVTKFSQIKAILAVKLEI